MLKRKWGAESNGRLPHLFIPSKTATLVPEFAVEDLPLGITESSVPAFAKEVYTLVCILGLHIKIIININFTT